MIKYLEEFGKHIAIAGFRDVKIANVEALLEKAKKGVSKNTEVQFFDARFVATWQHLYFAALNALKAFKNHENISKNLAIETLLYASAQRQIRKAMELLGVKQNSKEIAVLIIGEKAGEVDSAIKAISKTVGGKRDDEVLELSREKIEKIRNIFEISSVELEAITREGAVEKALTDLVIERMALLATEH
ncbi:MAG: KEOPS complex subunit Cgi121 [Candidatus Bathyarchaeia archaeon]